MITINLTPVEELENPYWWIPDVSALATIMLAVLAAVYFYISRIEAEIALHETEKTRLVEETNRLNTDVQQFNSLNATIAALDSKKNALLRITESKLVRYLPIILLENIQNLKPEGVWLTSLAFLDRKAEPAAANPDPNPPAGEAQKGSVGKPDVFNEHKDKDYPITIEINGGARSNVLIAEFMMALKATQNQSFETSDLRTQLFFSDVGISFSQISTEGAAEDKKGRKSNVSFKLQLSFRERAAGTPDANKKFSQFIESFKRDGQATMN